MKKLLINIILVFICGASFRAASAADRYVSLTGGHVLPYTNWADAATNIQAAISASSDGDVVWVTNGTYEVGGAPSGSPGSMLINRVAITKAITVCSANNDPTNTIIKGAWDPATNGPAAIRCVYMVKDSSLIGFTLTNGATFAVATVSEDTYGGGIYCKTNNATISNCVIAGNSAAVLGGGVYCGTLDNSLLNCALQGNSAHQEGGGVYLGTLFSCLLTGNSAPSLTNGGGGGAYGSILSNCTLSGNSAVYGGGASGGTLYNCTLSGNSVLYYGGGAIGSILSNCTLSGNSANIGGGASGGTLYNCTLSGNSASFSAGGANAGTLYSCTLSGNSAVYGGGGMDSSILYNSLLTGNSASFGGGASGGSLYNCTLSGNSAVYGGGVYGGYLLYNCVSWNNSSPDYTDIRKIFYSCGVGYSGNSNIALDPQFISTANYRLTNSSPCLDAGTNFSWMTDPSDPRSKDLDGNPRIQGGAVNMGAYEYEAMPPAAPTGVAASGGTYRDKVRVTWNARALAAGYEVWRNSSADTNTAALLGNTTGVFYDDTTTPTNVTYYYWVKATNSYGASPFSDSASGYKRSPAPGELAFSAATYTVTREAGSVTLTVTRSGLWGDYAAGVNYSTLDGTAIAGVDYTAVSGTLAWADYDTSVRTITVPIINRAGLQGDYDFTVNLSGASGATLGSPSNSSVTIQSLNSPSLAIDAGSLANSVLENCSATNAAAINVWNGASAPRGGMIYSVTPCVDWLSVNPSSGTVTNNTNTIAVVWSAGSHAPGTYTGYLVVDGTDLLGNRALNAPQTINVQMTVLSRTPVNYEKPVIYGAPYIGQTLSVRNGLWQNMDRLTFSYQWQRADNAAGAGLANIAGEIASNHVVVLADRGEYMRVAVTATDAVPPPRSATAYSELISTAKIRALAGDFNSDGIADLWFFDPLTAVWHAAFTGDSFAEGQFGSAGMTDVPGDYNGDGILDLGLYDSAHGMWYILYLPAGPSVSGSMFGGVTEETQATPVPADYNGDGYTDVALYWRGYWAILYSGQWRITIIPPIAGADAVPAPGDYDGDGAVDLAVYDGGVWTIRNVWGDVSSVSFGAAGWLPAPADYDGDTITDLCVYNQSSNVWSMLSSASGVTNSRSFGASSGANLPRQGYYDHDRYCDPATLQYSADGDFVIWSVTRTTDTNRAYRGQSYQKSINDWRVSW